MISIIYRRVNIQKYVENPWFTGKKSTNGGFSTSMLVYRMENYLKNRVGLRASRSWVFILSETVMLLDLRDLFMIIFQQPQWWERTIGFLNVSNIFSHATTHSAVVHGATGWYLPSHQLRHAPTRRGGVWVAIAAARSIPNCPSWSGWSDASFRPGPGPWSLG